MRDAFNNAIGEIFSQFTSNNLSWWYLIAFFFWKMILPKTWYKTHDEKLLAIIKALKTWKHYLEDCKYKFLVLTNCNNL